LLEKLTEDFDVRLTDFGSAFPLADKNRPFSGLGLGTTAYNAPELGRLPPEPFGLEVDVFSCGVTLYCMMSGNEPYANLRPVVSLSLLFQYAFLRLLRPGTSAAGQQRRLLGMGAKPQAIHPGRRFTLYRDLKAGVDLLYESRQQRISRQRWQFLQRTQDGSTVERSRCSTTTRANAAIRLDN
jgi:serine/threonine protein kinase